MHTEIFYRKRLAHALICISFALLMSFAIFCGAPIASYASDNVSDSHIVVDDADLWSDSEEAVLRERASELREKYGGYYILYTVQTTKGLKPLDCIDEMVYSNGMYDAGGLVFFVNMSVNDLDNRTYEIYAFGDTENIIEYDEIDKMLDRLESDMRSGDYYDAARSFLDEANDAARFSTRRYVYGVLRMSPVWLVISVVTALLIAWLSVVGVKKQYTLAGGTYLYDLKSRARVSFTKKNDTFIGKSVVFTVIQSSSSGSHGSRGGGSHRSSGGRSYSGGGRRF